MDRVLPVIRFHSASAVSILSAAPSVRRYCPMTAMSV